MEIKFLGNGDTFDSGGNFKPASMRKSKKKDF